MPDTEKTQGRWLHTECLPADHEGIIKAARVLTDGGLVAFPTETVYGLGGNALNPAAIAAIFNAKGRPADNPLIAHVLNAQEAARYGEWNALAQTLAEAFWPGPLTLIVPRKSGVPAAVSAGLDSLALRAPSHPAARALIAACGFPLAAPSANRSGSPSPTTARHVLSDLDGRIPLILDGGASEVGLESTVVDATGDLPLILRPGAVTPEMIAMVVGECRIADSVMRQLKDYEVAPSPGMRHQHYAPHAHLTLVDGSPEDQRKALLKLAAGRENTWVLALDGLMREGDAISLQPLGKDAHAAAHRLFYLLRRADEEGVEALFAQTLPRDGLGLAVMNRMVRAAGFDILDAKSVLNDEPQEER